MTFDKKTETDKIRDWCSYKGMREELKKTVTLSQIIDDRNNRRALLKQKIPRVAIIDTLIVILCIIAAILSVTSYTPVITVLIMAACAYVVKDLYHTLLIKPYIHLKLQDKDVQREIRKKVIYDYIASTQYLNIAYPTDCNKPENGHPCLEMFETLEKVRIHMETDFVTALMERMDWENLAHESEEESRLIESSVNLYQVLQHLLSQWWFIANKMYEDIQLYSDTGLTDSIAKHTQEAKQLAQEATIMLNLDYLDSKK